MNLINLDLIGDDDEEFWKLEEDDLMTLEEESKTEDLDIEEEDKILGFGKEEYIQSHDPIREYLKEISHAPLLSKNQEIDLALKICKEKEASELDNRHRQETGFWPALSKERTNIKMEAKKASSLLVKSNLRLVVSVAKKYLNRGMDFLDLIQEGNIGLMKAVEKYDHTKGFKFSTYATWWIRQGITRALAMQTRTIRLPVHMSELIAKVKKAKKDFTSRTGKIPNNKELALELGMPLIKLEKILEISLSPISLDLPSNDSNGPATIGSLIPDLNPLSDPMALCEETLVREEVEKLLSSLSDRDKKVISLRYGLVDGHEHTLAEIGALMKVTRERVRQIEAKALALLKKL